MSSAPPSPGHRAVVVDDDDDIRDLLVRVLEKSGIEVASAASGQEGLDLVRDFVPDLVTLDLSLPDLDGVEVCRRLREFSDAYVVMITGRSDEIDRLLGLEMGADDYMSKPFSPREVTARCGALLRRPRQPGGRTGATSAPVDIGGGLTLHPVRQVAMHDGEPLSLTPTELDVLTALTSRPGHVWHRAELVASVWQGEFIESDFLVDIQVGSLRRKIKKACGRDVVTVVGGDAYRFDAG
ncbi:MAG: response regulator transcription factor [Nocardioides sp.]